MIFSKITENHIIRFNRMKGKTERRTCFVNHECQVWQDKHNKPHFMKHECVENHTYRKSYPQYPETGVRDRFEPTHCFHET